MERQSPNLEAVLITMNNDNDNDSNDNTVIITMITLKIFNVVESF